MGGKFQAGNGFTIIGAHTDSPHLQVKPNPEVKSDYVQIEIEPYGGGKFKNTNYYNVLFST